MTENSHWNEVYRNGELIHVHKEKPIWIVCYEGIDTIDYVRPTYWQAYRAVTKVKQGASPWSADNKKRARLSDPGSGDGRRGGRMKSFPHSYRRA